MPSVFTSGPSQRDNDESRLSAVRRTKLTSSDPPLAAVSTAYATHHSCRSFTHQSSWPDFNQVSGTARATGPRAAMSVLRRLRRVRSGETIRLSIGKSGEA
jgi:hypothetical protein